MRLTRWAGKPTSGRYVYRGRLSKRWWWQCDLHDDDDDLPGNSWGQSATWEDALARLLEHANRCPNHVEGPALSGVCHCGTLMDEHSAWDNHSPVDMAE